MSRYDIYQSNAAEVPVMRKWVIRALIISLLIHFGLFVFFQFKKLENFRMPVSERLAVVQDAGLRLKVADRAQVGLDRKRP